MKNAVVSRVEEIATRVGAAEGIEIVEVEFKGSGAHRFLRISIDKPEGVNHHDCELISQQVGTILDVEDVIPGGSYTLEVSSPGVERKLRKLSDFDRFRGKKAKLVFREPVGGASHCEGVIEGVEGELVRFTTAKGELLAVPFDRISRANLKFDW